jgi:predicted transcriptional regulator
MLTPRQLRAARALLGWSRETLSAASKVPAVTISEFETGKTDPRLTTVNKLRRALERAGVVFIDADGRSDEGEGVRAREKSKE